MLSQREMDIMQPSGGGGAGGADNRPMNQQVAAADQPQTQAYGDDQSDEECPRYMLAGTLT